MSEISSPRRSRKDLNVPAELAIYNAMQEVEKVGADERLTNAVIKLQQARNLVADFIDGIQSPDQPSKDQSSKGICDSCDHSKPTLEEVTVQDKREYQYLKQYCLDLALKSVDEQSASAETLIEKAKTIYAYITE